MPRRQRTAETKQSSAPARTRDPFDRIAYLVHIAAFFIESWKDAVIFAGVNRSSRETIESYLSPETAAVIAGTDCREPSQESDYDFDGFFGGGSPTLTKLINNSKLWPTATLMLDGGSEPHSPAWLIAALIKKGATTASDVLSRLDGFENFDEFVEVSLVPALAVAREPDIDFFIKAEHLWKWVAATDLMRPEELRLLGRFPRHCMKLEPAEAFRVLCALLPQQPRRGVLFGPEGRHSTVGLYWLLKYPCFANDDVLLFETRSTLWEMFGSSTQTEHGAQYWRGRAPAGVSALRPRQSIFAHAWAATSN